jgi:hypothetical protein
MGAVSFGIVSLASGDNTLETAEEEDGPQGARD